MSAHNTTLKQKIITAALSSIDDEVQKLRLDKLAKESRRQALEEEIARASERIEKRVASDPIAAELQKVVEIREQSVQLMKKMSEGGHLSQTELSEGVAKAAEARAKMLQQQREAAAAAGGASLEGFNKELMTLAIDSREQEAKLKHLEERLPRLREAVEMLHQYRQVEQAAQEARDAVVQAERERRDLRRRLQVAEPPRVLLKESINTPPPASPQ